MISSSVFGAIFVTHMKANSFPKSQRLKSRKKLQQLFTTGKSIRAQNIRLVYLVEENTSAGVKCGVGVSSKYFKKAADRNRIKRLLREAYRLQQHTIKKYAGDNNTAISLFFLYTGKALPSYTDVFENVVTALKKLLTTIHAIDTKNT